MSDVVERHPYYHSECGQVECEKPQMENEITRLRGLLEEARALGCPLYSHHDLCTRIDAALKGNQ